MEEMLEIFGLEFADSFFIYALPWLLVFAVVYGFLSQMNIPKEDSPRAIIAIVLAFFSLLFAEPLMAFLKTFGGSTIVVLTGILFFLILLEMTHSKGAIDYISQHTRATGLIILGIVVVLFLGSGGGGLIGLERITQHINPVTVFFLAVVVLAIWWMMNEDSNGGDEGSKQQTRQPSEQ